MDNIKPAIPSSARVWRYWFPVLLMLSIQFIFSTGSFSSSETSKFIIPLLRFLLPHSQMGNLAFWHHVVRKAAHVTEYCVLGVLTYRALRIDISSAVKVGMLTVFFVAAAASGDEFHQSFVPSRGSSIVDVGYDFMGGVIALFLIWLWRTARVSTE